jgi:hypothetical protein
MIKIEFPYIPYNRRLNSVYYNIIPFSTIAIIFLILVSIFLWRLSHNFWALLFPLAAFILCLNWDYETFKYYRSQSRYYITKLELLNPNSIAITVFDKDDLYFEKVFNSDELVIDCLDNWNQAKVLIFIDKVSRKVFFEQYQYGKWKSKGLIRQVFKDIEVNAPDFARKWNFEYEKRKL